MRIYISNMQNRRKKPYKLGDQDYRDELTLTISIIALLHVFRVTQLLYSTIP